MAGARPRGDPHAMKRTAALAATAAAFLVCLAGPAGPSPASASAWNEGKVYLRWPIPVDFGSVCVRRTITLKAGTYDWKVYVVHPSNPRDPTESVRWLGLRAGKYRWQDCLGEDKGQGGHVHCSWLDDLSTPGGPAKLCHYSFGGYGNGIYEFGSGLNWTGPPT